MNKENQIGTVESYLNHRRKEKALCLPLIDPVNQKLDSLINTVNELEKNGADALLVGGSTMVDVTFLDDVILKIKSISHMPVILFPNNITGISKNADAILFMMLMNSENTYYVVEAQVLGSGLIYKYHIEPIPAGYIVINAGSAVSHIGHARPLPNNREIISLYSLAAKYFGFRLLYLEGGSGTAEPISSNIVEAAKKYFNGLLIVGGGIKDKETAASLLKAGADGLVIGNLLEEKGGTERFKEISNLLKSY
ncbi:MAG: geranylgeranylglyceryl/heptaprenylglyceryl phosphate synthase [Nitrososphaerota archaeon]|jgi:phosphoglycerol geranylgeranyltransferase|nr:geranylgeranylglyceryl/heptaprenylglyceryl phosphate synthase [Nitrososphaerota archaeon]MDG6927222.1 geranylgeranylglyceryl/heptaprenylglyceryl phosphate synthase [Nitrososphaerota archaeon]MDG6929720.1 geranylgeranylglyceryl/heptaprenylglyceryl phosphate synthase [Nitrososphaerota archaeon]MDG6932665.1 geranylgeranylglyceryl/heptaprenylglyceryl phosphate synthase [Nitrososphaerota archaeon]MDG6936123.1 geranylgeranylglyceryl/heptaprenylglyceryl phosphate synthase [Nitrososphaerota archaeon